MRKCEICGAEFKCKFGNMFLCLRHYLQMCNNGKISFIKHRCSPSEIIDYDNYCEIILCDRNGKEKGRAKIDKDQKEKIGKYRWCMRGKGYVHNGKIGQLHIFIMGKKEGYEIDHKFGDKLDNRKKNLRYVTRQQNIMNRKVLGVRLINSDRLINKKWQAYLYKNNQFINLGNFTDKQDAINARRQAEQKYFGEFAYQYN